VLNQEIQSQIIPRVDWAKLKSTHHLELNDLKIQNIESVLKYIRLTKYVKSLDLSCTNLSVNAYRKIVSALASREINLNRLNLSRNERIDNEVCMILSSLFSENSPIKHLCLDDTSVTESGVAEIVSSIKENLKVHTLTFKHCKVNIHS